MFNNKSIYALNKKDPDAIVYRYVDNVDDALAQGKAGAL